MLTLRPSSTNFLHFFGEQVLSSFLSTFPISLQLSLFSTLVFHCMKVFLRTFLLALWQESEGYSPLLVACKFNKTDLVKYLLGFPEVDPTLKTSVSSVAWIPEYFLCIYFSLPQQTKKLIFISVSCCCKYSISVNSFKLSTVLLDIKWAYKTTNNVIPDAKLLTVSGIEPL